MEEEAWPDHPTHWSQSKGSHAEINAELVRLLRVPNFTTGTHDYDPKRHENPFICHIMNLLWSLDDKGTCVRFCWVPNHCGNDGNERVDQLAKETLDQDVDPLASVHHTDLKPLVNSYIQ